ncbi:MAG: hypothetical protein MUC29_09505 [Pyrinomonadaceae bacterium]|nr:hypothetical protein [Pyrinomonadaceae bacterium]
MDKILFIVFAFYGFIFFAITSIITWCLSKKNPSLWYVNKIVLTIYLIITTLGFCDILLQKYYKTTIDGRFSKSFGFRPNTEILKDLRVESIRKGDLEQENIFFSTDKESFKELINKCFYEISEAKAIEQFTSLEGNYLKDFIGKPKVRYYERPSYDVEETNCISDFSHVIVAYDEENGKVFYQWNFNHF